MNGADNHMKSPFILAKYFEDLYLFAITPQSDDEKQDELDNWLERKIKYGSTISHPFSD